MINLYPEIFFLPWLVAKGLLPYRDFFDHHGFLLYYLLAPLSLDKSLFLLKAGYYFFLLLNFGLFIIIVRRWLKGWQLLLFSGLIYVLLNFFINEQNFWYEIVITSFYLITYWFLDGKKRPNYLLAGGLIALASLIKPTAGLIIILLWFLYRRLAILIGFITVWLLTLGFFWQQGALTRLWSNLFLFNSKLPEYVAGTYHWQNKQFLLITLILFLVSLWIMRTEILKRRSLVLLSFITVSAIFPYPSYGKVHLAVLAVFVPLWFAFCLKFPSKFFQLLLGTYLIYLLWLNYGHWYYLHTKRQTYQQSSSSQTIIKYYKKHHNNQPFYVFGNQVELYYYLNQLPPTYFPLYFSNWTGRFFPDFEAQTITALKANKIRLVLVPKPIDLNYRNLPLLKTYLNKHYFHKEFAQFKIYTALKPAQQLVK